MVVQANVAEERAGGPASLRTACGKLQKRLMKKPARMTYSPSGLTGKQSAIGPTRSYE